MGTLGAAAERAKLAALGRQGVARAAAKVEKIWDDIERAAGKLTITPGMIRIYQDGLPVCGREREIVAEVAAAGSRNHQLLMKLQARGAILMGTESAELLLEEHQRAKAALEPGKTPGGGSGQAEAPDTLIERRDRYIAARIHETLNPGETGILFMGLLHNVPKYLDPGITVSSLRAAR
jgi:hypothetical protein